MKKYIGSAAIIIFSLIPILLWLPSLKTGSGGFSLRSLSQILALSGATLLSINFILSGRFKFIEPFFGGLNRMYIVHHLTGAISLILLSFHPVVLGFYYIPISMEAAFGIIFPPLSEIATWLGMAGYLTMSFLLVLTLYVKLPYNIWKATHKFIGLALMFATLHIMLIASSVSTNLPLRIYMLFFCFLGLAVYFQRTILGRFFVKHYGYNVTAVHVLGNITHAILSPVTSKMVYKPGQFIFIRFKSIGVTSEEHPFSLTSSPDEPYISITAKSSGDYTETLKLLKTGTEAQIEGPFGGFSFLDTPRKKQIWIAGGIGITPFVSMSKVLVNESGYDIKLYYVVATPGEAVFLKLLTDIANRSENLTVTPVYTKTQGRLTANIVAKNHEDFLERQIFVCGPPPMMKSLREQFNKLGVRNSRIVSEEFSLD